MAPRLLLVIFAITVALRAQSVSSGSTGIDGALILATPGTIVFDPRTFNPPLNAAGDNVYQFTSIYIGLGVTVKLSAKTLSGPVFWLAQGPVQIDGAIDLNGEDGVASPHFPNNAGAGGYQGGIHGKPGDGPGAGTGAGHPGGVFTGNQFLVPLVGGSGGAAGENCGGGAGAGALLIASSTSITVNGSILANGGNPAPDCQAGGGGSGGSIRLVASVIDGSGMLAAKGSVPGVGNAGGDVGNAGGNGRVRLETFANNLRGSADDTPPTTGKPFRLFLPPNPPAAIRVVGVAGVLVAAGSKELSLVPQVTLNTSSRVTIGVEARFVPPGTVVELEFYSENGTEQIVKTTPLAGTLEQSTAIAIVTILSGASLGYARANWK
jgi:hypothetical protein